MDLSLEDSVLKTVLKIQTVHEIRHITTALVKYKKLITSKERTKFNYNYSTFNLNLPQMSMQQLYN